MIMSKFKKLYRDFFGLNEQTSAAAIDAIKTKADELGPVLDDLKTKMSDIGLTKEDTIEEAQLINNLTDYNGHVMYRLRDPQEASAVAKEIQRWTTKKGFTIISHKKSSSGLTGYFYFRLGEDPGTESQKIQGYFAQLPELSRFAFQAPRSRKKPPARRMPPKRKI
jgi:hypothetical protein